MSMGMMMVPPAVMLPFKLAFFATADGWSLLSRAGPELPAMNGATALVPARGKSG